MNHVKETIVRASYVIAVMLAALCILMAGCNGDTDDENPPGLQISYVNSTGYSNALLIAWEPVSNASLYLLTKSDGRVAHQLWLEGTEFIDTQLPVGRRYSYSLQSYSNDGALTAPGVRAIVRNNRTVIAQLNTRLRSAKSPSEVKRILSRSLALNFNAIFVGLDSARLSFNDQALLFSFFVAHNFAPYANSRKFDLMELLQEQGLDCDNYAVLTGMMFDLITHGTRPHSIEYYGFDGGAVGNHAQLIYKPDTANEVWLVDPTVGLLARYRSTEEIFEGGKPQRVSNYYGYYESDSQPLDMLDYLNRVRAAIESGSYTSDEIIYKYVTLADYIEAGS